MYCGVDKDSAVTKLCIMSTPRYKIVKLLCI